MKNDDLKSDACKDVFDFGPLVILRTPLFSYSEWARTLEALLDLDEFRTAIHTASPILYEEISKKHFRADLLTQKEKTSLKKYHNRICFRPTPFGILAGFSVLKWGTSPLVVSTPRYCRAHILADFSEMVTKDKNIPSESLLDLYVSNQTLYRAGNEYRFVSKGREQKQTSFAVDSIGYSDWLHSLLEFCQKTRTIQEMVLFTAQILGQDLGYSLNVLLRLIEVQVLLPDDLPRITGKDCCKKSDDNNAFVSHFMDNEYLQISELNDLYKTPSPPSTYLNMERPVLKGGISDDIQKDIQDGIEVGRLFVPLVALPSMEKFKSGFLKRFDQQTVSLMEALDPEFGVGYEDHLKISTGSVLTEDVKRHQAEKGDTHISWTPPVQLLVDKMFEGKKIIRFTESDIRRLEATGSENDQGTESPGISVVFRKCNDGKTYLESAGGASCLSLIGRFTPFNQRLSLEAMSISKLESKCNPNIVFAEIVHFSDPHVANIERRLSLRDYEIPILTGSGVDEEHRIAVNDLWISVRDNEIVLWSKRLNKRVIPRLDSAYNHTISDLPVFRFLCDLQQQRIRTHYSFSPKDLLPGLKHYPRLEFKNTVVSLEEWHVEQKEWMEFTSLQPDLIRNWLEEKGIPRMFAITSADRQIVIDMYRSDDLQMLSWLYKGKVPAIIVIKEFPFINPSSMDIQDESGNGYLGQYIALLRNRYEVYHHPSNYKPFERSEVTLPNRINYLQSDWLYYKIYCHEGSANKIIAAHVFPLSREMETIKTIHKWFFVRYNDGDGFHLRLRFLIAKGSASNVMERVHASFSSLLEDGTVSKMLIAPYERELERYGVNVVTAESFFHIGSKLAAAQIHYCSNLYGQPTYYAFVFRTINSLTARMGLDERQKASFHENCYEGFRREQRQPRELFKQLQVVLRKFREVLDPFCFSNGSNEEMETEFQLYEDGLKGLSFNNTYSDEYHTFLSSLVHMQINRILVDDFRFQEMVIHYILWKHHISLTNRKDLKKVG